MFKMNVYHMISVLLILLNFYYLLTVLIQYIKFDMDIYMVDVLTVWIFKDIFDWKWIEL